MIFCGCLHLFAALDCDDIQVLEEDVGENNGRGRKAKRKALAKTAMHAGNATPDPDADDEFTLEQGQHAIHTFDGFVQNTCRSSA